MHKSQIPFLKELLLVLEVSALPRRAPRALFDKVCAVWFLAEYSYSKNKPFHGDGYSSIYICSRCTEMQLTLLLVSPFQLLDFSFSICSLPLIHLVGLTKSKELKELDQPLHAHLIRYLQKHNEVVFADPNCQ